MWKFALQLLFGLFIDLNHSLNDLIFLLNLISNGFGMKFLNHLHRPDGILFLLQLFLLFFYQHLTESDILLFEKEVLLFETVDFVQKRQIFLGFNVHFLLCLWNNFVIMYDFSSFL